MQVLIYQPSKTAMQSGKGKTKGWRLKFLNPDAHFIDPVMNWIGSKDTSEQVELAFPDQESAVAFAKKKKLEYTIQKPNRAKILPKSYNDTLISKI